MTSVYIDGFNFYYGSVKDGPYRWLDFVKLSQLLLRGHKVETVKYFTARVQDRPGDPHQSQRQDTYLRALGTLPEIEIYYGQFRTQRKRLPLAENIAKKVNVLATEEKGSDVALGSHLVWDACHGLVSDVMVISNDSDLQTPLNMAMQLGVKVIVVNPHRHRGQRDHLFGGDRRKLQRRHLDRSQLPDVVEDAEGRYIHKPAKWA